MMLMGAFSFIRCGRGVAPPSTEREPLVRVSVSMSMSTSTSTSASLSPPIGLEASLLDMIVVSS